MDPLPLPSMHTCTLTCCYRNSTDLVESAFDGDLDLLQSLIAKGFHLESTDGRKHTALSEAASQGHMHIVQYLLQASAANANRLPFC